VLSRTSCTRCCNVDAACVRQFCKARSSTAAQVRAKKQVHDPLHPWCVAHLRVSRRPSVRAAPARTKAHTNARTHARKQQHNTRAHVDRLQEMRGWCTCRPCPRPPTTVQLTACRDGQQPREHKQAAKVWLPSWHALSKPQQSHTHTHTARRHAHTHCHGSKGAGSSCATQRPAHNAEAHAQARVARHSQCYSRGTGACTSDRAASRRAEALDCGAAGRACGPATPLQWCAVRQTGRQQPSC
jgi:hypothetical protein